MGDKENCLLRIFQKEGQPLNGRNVQMVGRLVQKQEVVVS